MLDIIMQTSLRNRMLVVLAGCVILLSGLWVTDRLPVDVFPDLTAPTVTIMTEAHGMAPEEVELLVTFPIETAVNGAAGVRRVRSNSIQGFSTVWVEFDWGMEIYRARQIVNEKLQALQGSLPKGVDQPMLAPITSLMGEIMTIGLSSDTLSLMDLRTLADFNLRRRLLAIPGVSQVQLNGGEVKQYQILLDPHRLRRYGLTLHQVHLAAGNANLNAAGGFYIHSGKEYLIRGLGRVRDIDELAQTVVSMQNEVPVLLRDVATIRIGAAIKIGEASINNKHGVLLVISKQPEGNTLHLTQRLQEALSEIEPTLPVGTTMHRDLFIQADFISRAVDNVIHALRDGAILVIVILLLFLADLRTVLISALAIPLSLVISLLILYGLGLSINTMTLGGMAIAIGILVDDAIIYVENVHRRLSQTFRLPKDQRQPLMEVIFKASSEVRAPIANATFIVIIVFLPLFFLSGIEGRMLKPLGIAYVVSIFASLVVAITITPALSSYLLTRERKSMQQESWMVRFAKRLYEPVLRWSLRRRLLVVGSAAITLAITLALTPLMGRSFMPEFNEGTLNISFATVPGTSLKESDYLGQIAEKQLLQLPGVVTVSRRTGRTEMDEHSLGSHAAEIEVDLDFTDLDRDELLESIRERLSLIPGTVFVIGQPISHRIDHMLSGTRANIAVKIFGSDLYELRRTADRIHTAMSRVEGITDLSVDQQTDIPQVRIRANREKMAVYGLTMADVDEMIDTAFLGAPVSQVYEGQNQFDMIVRYDEPFRDDLDAVRRSLVDTPIGVRVPLEMVMDIQVARGPNYISRENVQRKIVVQANVQDRDLGSVIDDIRAEIAAVELPESYYIQFGGQFESEQQARKIITGLSLLSILLIFLALYIEFKNLHLPLVIMMALPFALIGGILAILVTNGVLTIASLVGFITLFGVAIRNGIIMVSHYNHLQGEKLSIPDAVLQGSLDRLSPVMMTGLTTGLALTPLAFAAHKPGNEIQAPLAIVVLGGLITSTVLTLIVLPVVYEWVENRKQINS